MAFVFGGGGGGVCGVQEERQERDLWLLLAQDFPCFPSSLLSNILGMFFCCCWSVFCRADGVMRTMAPEKLLKSMPILQGQIDALLEFDVCI